MKRSLGWTFGTMAAGSGLLLISTTGDNSSQEMVAAGVSLGVLGLFAGPCKGLSYAGKRRPYNSAFNRLAILGIGFVTGGATWAALGGEISIFGGPSQDQTNAEAAILVIYSATLIIFIKSIVSDFRNLGKYVDEYNSRNDNFTTISLEPTYFSNTKSYGLSLKLSF